MLWPSRQQFTQRHKCQLKGWWWWGGGLHPHQASSTAAVGRPSRPAVARRNKEPSLEESSRPTGVCEQTSSDGDLVLTSRGKLQETLMSVIIVCFSVIRKVRRYKACKTEGTMWLRCRLGLKAPPACSSGTSSGKYVNHLTLLKRSESFLSP